MLNLKKIMALAIIAAFLASIPLTVSGNNQGLVSATYTIEVDAYYAKPGGTPGGGKGAAGGYVLTGYHWDTLLLTLIINPKDSGLLGDEVLNAITVSAGEWDSHTTAVLVSNYQLSDTASVSDESTAPDGANELVFGNLGDSRIIAQCTYWYYRGSKHLVDFDIVFNTQFTWGDALGNPSVMDLQNIATHELGHGFGLGDLYQLKWSEQTMYGYASEGQINKRTLESGDIAGIQALYGT
jgi:hypothetical protein